MKYKCTTCEKEHDEWPALAFASPYNYNILSEKDKKSIAELNEDFCVIKYEDQTDLFIRTILLQKVNDGCQNLDYGVWVSLSKKSFDDYSEHFKTGNQDVVYFGYLCSKIPEYDDTLSIKMNVIVKKGTNRPEVIPHEDQMDIPFVRDYYNGITVEEVERRIDFMLNL